MLQKVSRAGVRVNCLCLAWKVLLASRTELSLCLVCALQRSKQRGVRPRPILQGMPWATQSINEVRFEETSCCSVHSSIHIQTCSEPVPCSILEPGQWAERTESCLAGMTQQMSGLGCQ